MTLCAASACVVTKQRTLSHHAIQTADLFEFASSDLRGKLAHLPCRLNVKQPVHVIQLLAIHQKNLTRKTLAFALPNENGEAERCSSHACTNDELLMHSECSDMEVLISITKKKIKDMDVFASVSHAEADLCRSVEPQGNQVSLLDKLKAVHSHVLASEEWNVSRLKLCHRNYLVGATNLIHYLALKSLDVEELKEDLLSFGLLNLETINSYVLPGLTANIQLLENLKSNYLNIKEDISTGICTDEGLNQQKNGKFTIHTMRKKASSNRELLLGTLQDDRTTHIMVTVGQETTESETLVTDLLKMGTSIVRINCAHGNPSVWSEIVRRVRRSSQMLEKPCRILMDLAGPKLRTANLKPGPCVMKISPKRNATGNVDFPALVWLSHKEAGPPPAHLSLDSVLFIDDKEFLSKLEVGDTLRFYDARGKKRTLKISRQFHVFAGTGYVAECTRTTYVQSGTELRIKGKKGRFPAGQVVDVPAIESFVRLRVGDLLIISRDSSEQDERSGPTSGTHRITCSSGYLFDSVKPGQPIAFDDGKIWGVIQGTSISEIIVSITHAGPKGTKLGSEKSINIPDSDIRFEGLTSKDLMDLEFVASHADMVGVSFVRDVRDIVVLRQELEKRKLQNLGVVLKIETKSGFEKLPLMLLEVMKSSNPLGVMIARGDLAVECGWERLANIQEQILTMCDAAHIPVIWATQVLESLVKSGVPTRAEITDVAKGRRASCIMLNKGKHVVEAVSTLDTILHSNSKQMKAELKPLVLSSHLF